MALDFPSSPSNGQIYDNYYWDDATGVWNSLGNYAVPNLLSNGVFTSSASLTTPLTVKGHPSQAASLQEWKNSSGTNLASISASGGLSLNNALTVPNGGTGATTAAIARSNLEITPANIGAQVAGSYAAASHNHDASNITSGSLAIARGGTGFSVGTGLVPVTPTSVRVGSATVSSTGRVSVTSGTGFTLDGIFTSAFRNYKIIIDHRNMGGAYEYFRFIYGDNNWTSAGAYYGGGFYRQGSATGIWQNTGDGYSYGSIGYTADGGYTTLDVMSPQWNGSYGKVLAFNSYGAGNHTQVWSDWMWNGWDAFTGIYIYNGGANYSAEVEVYGYNH